MALAGPPEGGGGPYDVTSLSLSLSKPAAAGLSLVSSVLRKYPSWRI